MKKRSQQLEEWRLRRRRMLEEKEEGYSGPQIAAKYGISSQLVYKSITLAKKERAIERRKATLDGTGTEGTNGTGTKHGNAAA